MGKTLWFGMAALVVLLLTMLLVFASVPPGTAATTSGTWLPWFLLAGLGAITWWSFRSLARHQASASPPPSTQDAGTAAGTPSPVPEVRVPAAPLHILASTVATVAGRTPEDVLQILCEAPALPAPDPELVDERGLPRLSARCPDLDQASLEAALPSNKGLGMRLRAPVLRALALQAATLEDLSPVLSRTPAHEPLDVLWMIPSHWSELEREHALAWLNRMLSTLRPNAASAAPIHMIAATAAATTLQRLRVHAGLTRPAASRAGCVLALACDCLLDETLVPPPSSEGGAPLPPGEAAAALMLWRVSPDAVSPPAGIAQESALLRLAVSQETGGVADTKAARPELRELLAQVLQAAEPSPPIERAVSDAGLSGPAARALLDALIDQLPGLDVSSALCRLGPSCGDLGAATSLVALALASQSASKSPTVMVLCDREPAVALLCAPSFSAAPPT